MSQCRKKPAPPGTTLLCSGFRPARRGESIDEKPVFGGGKARGDGRDLVSGVGARVLNVPLVISFEKVTNSGIRNGTIGRSLQGSRRRIWKENRPALKDYVGGLLVRNRGLPRTLFGALDLHRAGL